jgi:hydrogenase nickel incorporation protein HypA/HybF
MHENAVMKDIVQELERIGVRENVDRITRVDVELGALSHFTPEHFREHFEDAARGTLADGAEVAAVLKDDPTDPRAQGVVLLGVEVEIA